MHCSFVISNVVHKGLNYDNFLHFCHLELDTQTIFYNLMESHGNLWNIVECLEVTRLFICITQLYSGIFYLCT